MSQSGLHRWHATIVLSCVLTSSGALYGGRQINSGPEDVVIPEELVVQFADGADAVSVARAAAPDMSLIASGKLRTHVFRFKGAVPQARLEALARLHDVVFVERHHLRSSQVTAPNDPNYATQWALAAVRALDAWHLVPGTSALSGTRLKVAVLDTGTDCTHPDFRGPNGSVDVVNGGQLNMTEGIAYYTTTVTAAACTWQDDNGHGTHVAGIIGAATHNGTGVASLGYPLEIVTYKVLASNGYGGDFGIANAITRATDSGARVISMSLSGAGYSQTLQDAVNYAWARNVLVIAAAGNASTNAMYYPAGLNHVMAIAATDAKNARASYSNYGNAIAVAAPGSNILSTYPTSKQPTGYIGMSGTSMAAPHVSALAGLVASTTPDVATEAVQQRIQRTATGNAGWTQTLGFGIINAQAALSGTETSAATGAVVGQVVNAMRLPVSGAVVSAGGQTATTNVAGTFRLAGLAPGSYFLTMTATSVPVVSQTVAVIAGADSPVLLRAGVVTGTVRGTIVTSGAPVPGGVAYALSGSLKVAAVIADNNGNFEMLLPIGTYEVRASALGYLGASGGTVTLSEGSEASVVIPLPAMGSVTGTARDAAGVAVAGAAISLRGPMLAGAVSTANGTFSTIHIPVGQYTAACSAPWYRTPEPVAITVATGAVTTADCVLPAIALTVEPNSASLGPNEQVQLRALLDGVVTSAVTWTRTPAIGTLTSAGLFTAPAGPGSSETVTVTATSTQIPDKSASASFTLGQPPTLTLSAATVVGGNAVTGNIVRLGAVAPVGGTVISLSSSSPGAVIPPATVTIQAGAIESAPFTLATSGVAAATSVMITATVGGSTASATLVVNPSTLQSLTTAQNPLSAGIISVSRVYLTGQAPLTDAVVALSSNNPAVISVPAQITVPSGQSSAVFSISPSGVASATPVQVTATYAGVSRSMTVSVVPVALYYVTFATPSIPGGSTQTTNRVNLTGPAPAGGLTIALTTTTPAITPAPTVTIPEGATSANFSLTASLVDSSTPVSLTATLGSVAKTATAAVVPAFLTSIYMSPSLTGGTGNKGTASLSGITGNSGAVVGLTSSNPAVLSVPSQMTVPPGAATAQFTFTSTAVTATTSVQITATYAGLSRSVTVSVIPAALNSVTFATPSIPGGSTQTTNRVTLTGPAPAGGLTVALTTTTPAITPASTVTVPEGATSANFSLTAAAVQSSTPVSITARAGSVAKTAAATVLPPSLTSLYIPATLTGGTGSQGTVYLSGIAGAAGVSITLASSNSALASVPATVTVPAGATSAAFSFTTTPVGSISVVSFSAVQGGVTKSTSLTIQPR